MRRHPIIIAVHHDSRSLYEGFTLPEEDVVLLTFGEVYCSMLRRTADLLLIDCNFQPHVGLALLQEVKSRFPALPVLFLTEESSEEIALSAFRLGVRDYFRKPVDVIALRHAIHNLLQVKRQMREVRQNTVLPGDLPPQAGALCGGRDLPAGIMRAVCFAESHYREELSLEGMASMANMSKAHFCRVFKKSVGMPPVRYLKFVRIQRAQRLLRRRSDSIATVAARVGFKDVSNFNKNFLLFVGLTPTAYRRSLPL